jgi:hypothetical protein
MIDQHRFTAANKVLGILFPDLEMCFEIKKNRLCLAWTNYRGDRVSKLYQCNHDSLYPTINHKIPTGGTHVQAITQLANWVKGKPVFSIVTWQYWCGKSVGMKHGDKIIPILSDAGYPQENKCAWCGSKGRLDWYNFGKHSGLGCHHSNRCESLSTALKEWQKCRKS